MSDEKPAFHNTPDEQERKKKEEDRRVTQKEKRKEKREPEKDHSSWFWDWFQLISYIVLLVIVLWTYVPKFYGDLMYMYQNSKDAQFTREHPEYTKAIREIYEKAHGKADVDLKAYIGEVKKTYDK